MIEYTYVFVRMNMLPVQVAVQACHASLEMAKQIHWSSEKQHPHLLLVGVKDEQELLEVVKILNRNDIEYYKFYEPDMNNSLTALATVPIEADSPKREKLKKFRLLPPFIHNKI